MIFTSIYRICAALYAIFPSTTVMQHLPITCQPSKGVALPLERSSDSLIVCQRECRLYADYTKCRFFKASGLLLCRMRSVVCSQAIDSAVCYSFEKSVSVGCISQRRIHLPLAILLQHAVVEEQIMRSCLACNVNSALLGVSYDAYALLCRNMAYVIGAACLI